MNNVPFLNLEYFFRAIIDFLMSSHGGFWDAILAFLNSIRIYSTFISLALVAGIIYSEVKLSQIRKKIREEEKKVQEEEVTASLKQGGRRWQKISDHINSENPSDWRLAILEADIILEEMLDHMGLHGETMSEKLKSVEKSDFVNIDLAWEAHKIRNTIAHEGIDFEISHREARRVIGLYETVFKEFHFI